MKNKNAKKLNKRGFTLVEMLIAMGIFAMLSAMSVSSYLKFNNKIGVDLQAHAVAQDGHKAQVESMAVKRAAGGVYPGYGVYFSTSTPVSYIFYADLDNTRVYNAGEMERNILMPSSMSIARLCATGIGAFSPQGTCPTGYVMLSAAEISYKRPNPDANITVYNGASSNSSAASLRVYIKSSKGYERSIEFWSTGQISINAQGV
jgi:prepilin-type N-terminal cleavage/methylation domain-containing protein